MVDQGLHGPGSLEDVERVLDAVEEFMRSGRLEEARERCDHVLEAHSENADAYYLRGLIAFEEGDADLAEKYLMQAIRLVPDDAVYHCNLGNVQFSRGDMEAALASFRKSVECDSGLEQAHANLGLVLTELGRIDEGIAPLERALALNPGDVEALLTLGNAFRQKAEYDKAIECCRRAVGIQPTYAEAHRNLGSALAAAERYGEAEAAFRKSLQLNPQFTEAYTELGLMLFTQGKIDITAKHFIDPILAFRAVEERPLEEFIEFNKINKTKLSHDIDQLEYLQSRGTLSAEYADLADNYREIRSRLGDNYEGLLSDFDPPVSTRVRTTYNRIIHYAPAPQIEGGVLSPDLDVAKIEENFFNGPHAFTFFDGLLKEEALLSLRSFCLDSTIWCLLDYQDELESNLLTGFSCPLIFQIAHEIKQTFPGIFGPHAFTSSWAYKYFRKKSGLGVHCDDGAVSINFWITPDSANNIPEAGGLVLWNKKVPRDFLGEMTEQRQSMFEKVLAEPDAESFRVPYRCNRAVIFQSNVLHGTDVIDFKPGYENNRINMTFLYGKSPKKNEL